MDLHLTGKVAIVTGAGQGIGRAIANALAQEGVHVVAASRNAEKAWEASSAQTNIIPFSTDLSTPSGTQSLVDYTTSHFDHIDILINNVGGATMHTGGFLDTSDADWYSLFELNLMSMVRTTRTVLPIMLRQSSGAIINISSGSGLVPSPMLAEYSALKAAMTNLSKALSEEFGPKGIRVNTVSPGPVRTPLWMGPEGLAATLGKSIGAEREAVLNQLPQTLQLTLGRMLEAEEIASLVLFLVSDLSATIGADYIIDGGAIKTM